MNTDKAKGKVFLIPTYLAPETQDKFINNEIINVIKRLDHFFVENVRTARRFIGSLKIGKNIDEIQFFILDKKTSLTDILDNLNSLNEGTDIGIISESGCPGIADPGARLVAVAHEREIDVVPLIGPSSVVMAQMASGFNGQQFAFHGYLPIGKGERKNKIRELEKDLLRTGYTQIFIETPYRNDQLFSDLTSTLNAAIKLCVAANITSNDEFIKTKTIANWKKSTIKIGKVPAIFLIGQ